MPMVKTLQQRLDQLPELTGYRSASRLTEYADALISEWLRREKQPRTRRAYNPNAWLKREAYRLIVHTIELDKVDLLVQISRSFHRPSQLRDEASKNVFKLGLLAMFSDEDIMSRQQRHVFGNQMLFAWVHDVPFDFLNPFLAVTGGPQMISRKLSNREPEPGYEHRFKPDRFPAV